MRWLRRLVARRRTATLTTTTLAGLIAVGLTPAVSEAKQGDVSVEIVAYEGWKNNLKLSNGEAELIVTLDVGPRIISYRLADGQNVFKVYENQLGRSGEPTWQIRGGHRLWSSPEDPDRTYVPDNRPVRHEDLGQGRVLVVQPPDPTYRLQKEMEIQLAPSGSEVTVLHRIRNAGRQSTELAIWSLSVMAPGGAEIIPLPPEAPHPSDLDTATASDFAPQYSLAMWSYSDFTDPRYTFGSQAITLRQSPDRDATKIGLSNPTGIAAYLNDGTLFIKRYPYLPGRIYPDFGSNYETFTNQDMLEMETLSPLVRLSPGEAVEHVERWSLISGIESSKNHEALVETVLPKLKIEPVESP